MKRSSLAPIGLSLLVAIVYFAGAELVSHSPHYIEMSRLFGHQRAAIAALLIFGGRVWPGVFIGALAANLPTSISVDSAVGTTATGVGESLSERGEVHATSRRD